MSLCAGSWGGQLACQQVWRLTYENTIEVQHKHITGAASSSGHRQPGAVCGGEAV